MDRILNSAFDFFAYALPGFCILASFFLLDQSLEYGSDFLIYAGRLHVGSGVVLLALSYIVGFAITPFGRLVFKKIQNSAFIKRLDKFFVGNLEKFEENEVYETKADGTAAEMFISNKFILVRELAPNNFRYIETWHVYSMMSQNMVIAGFVAIPLILYKIFWHCPSNPAFWWATAGFVLLLSVLFMYNSVKFSTWSTNDHNAAITRLHLVARARKLAEENADTQKPARKP